MTGNACPDAEQLLNRARAGDAAALGSLLELYRNYLSLLARLQIGRRLQGKIDPADIVQEAFLKAHRSFSQFRGTTEEELTGWLRKILASKLVDLLRHYYGAHARDVRLERDLAAEMARSSQFLDRALAAPYSSPSQQAVRREQSVLLADALEQLPESYREVLILHHLEELTFPEVAQRMGRTVDSVEKLWTRALARLRRALEVPHEPD
jgi:RNA polymerase sigma-70 factor, ECF subfamily